MLHSALLSTASKLQVLTIVQFSITGLIEASVLEVITSQKLQHVLDHSYKHEAFQKVKCKLDLIEQPYLDKIQDHVYFVHPSTDISVDISTDSRPTYRTTYRPTDISVECRSICRPRCVARYIGRLIAQALVDRHIARALVDMLTDTRPICRLIC